MFLFLGPSDDYEPLGTFCGSAEPTYVSTKSNMYLVLVSDFSETFKGFKIKYYSGKKGTFDHHITHS